MRHNTYRLHVHAGIQKEIPPLPESYTTLTPVTVMKKDPIIRLMEGSLTSDGQLVKAAIEEEKEWQNNARRLISAEVQSIDDPIAWAAFHANALQPCNFDVTISSLLPLFPDDSKSVAMSLNGRRTTGQMDKCLS